MFRQPLGNIKGEGTGDWDFKVKQPLYRHGIKLGGSPKELSDGEKYLTRSGLSLTLGPGLRRRKIPVVELASGETRQLSRHEVAQHDAMAGVFF